MRLEELGDHVHGVNVYIPLPVTGDDDGSAAGLFSI